jgi:hypothetical protein
MTGWLEAVWEQRQTVAPARERQRFFRLRQVYADERPGNSARKTAAGKKIPVFLGFWAFFGLHFSEKRL